MAMVANVVKKATQSTSSLNYFSLWTWGGNYHGQLGLNDTDYRSSPTQVGAGTIWLTMASGYYHTIAAKSDGTLWAWGNSNCGQLGLNDSINRSSPAQIGTELWNIKSVDVGLRHTAIVKGDGTLWTWGLDSIGQLGLNDSINRSSPVQVGSLTNWKYCAAMSFSTVATKTDGTLWGWGFNNAGQLGTNDIVYQSSPVQIGTDTNWDVPKCSVYGGLTAVNKTDGTLWAFGQDNYGILINAYSTNTSSPIQIASANIWSSVSIGAQSAFFIKPNNTLWASGLNGQGQLGQNNRVGVNSPVQIGADTNWSTNITSSSTIPVAIKTDGTIWTWAGGFMGTGLNDTSYRSSPVQIGTDTTWSKVYGKAASVFALQSSTNNPTLPEVTPSASFDLYTWGYNSNGELALNDTIDRSSPTQVGAGRWSQVSEKTGVKTDGTLWVWGINNDGQLGQNNTISKSSPTQVGALTNWLKSQTGYNSIFALKTDGTLWAWGRNNYQNFTGFAQGHLGLNDAVSRSSPVQIGTDNYWSNFSTRRSVAGVLATKTDGTLWAWGDNGQGQLGLNISGFIAGQGNIYRSSPVQVGTDTNWSKIEKAVNNSFAIRTDGTLWTWGLAGPQSGLNSPAIGNKSSPVQIGTDNNWSSLASQNYSVAAIKTDGTLWTWGENRYGQLAHPSPVGEISANISSPTQVGAGTNWLRVAFGYTCLLATKRDGTLWSCGRNQNGQLGTNDTVDRSSPVQIGTASTWNTTFGTAKFNN